MLILLLLLLLVHHYICKYCGQQVYSLLTYILKDDLKNLNRKLLRVYCSKQLFGTTNLFHRTVICHSLHDCVSTGVLCVIAHLSIDESLSLYYYKNLPSSKACSFRLMDLFSLLSLN